MTSTSSPPRSSPATGEEPRTPSRFLGQLPAGAFEVLDPAAADRPADTALRSAEVLAGLRSSLAGLKTRISP